MYNQSFTIDEKSRFIYQLELLNNKNYEIKYYNAQFEMPKKQTIDYVFSKSSEVIKKLREISDSGFSPSSLIRYMDDPINFFDNYLLKTDEEKNVIENPEALGVGRIFHNSLQDLYEPLVGKSLTVSQLNGNNKRLEKVIGKRFEEEYGQNFMRGKNLIVSRGRKKFIEYKKRFRSDFG